MHRAASEKVLHDTYAAKEHAAQVASRKRMPLFRCKLQVPQSFCIVLRNAQPCKTASPNHKLANAAARLGALPCKLKPFCTILSNAPAIDIAAF
jgi:hypothetical protein